MPSKTIKPFTDRQEKIASALVVKPMSRINTWLYQISGGRIGGTWLRGAPVLLLTTIGRKSGQPRTVPVLYLRDEDNVVVVASKGGMNHHPLWYRNLETNPEVEIAIGTERRRMVARRATEDEKTALWPRLVEMYRDFDDYQARTERNIPVVILSPL
jgi:deazaflavin-dependent oxidoreductase (nitroreductase family)